MLQSLTANEYFGMNLGGEFPGPSFVDREYPLDLQPPLTRANIFHFQLLSQAWKQFEPTWPSTWGVF